MKRKTDEMNSTIANLKNEIVLIKETSEDLSTLKSDLSLIKKRMEEFAALKASVITLTDMVSALQKRVDALISAGTSNNSGPSLTVSE
jgi:hypothetical protein